MLTSEDLQKLIKVFATKDDLKESIPNLTNKDDFSNPQTSIDFYDKKADTYFQEIVALSHKIDCNEK
jgi:hypothetical protein